MTMEKTSEPSVQKVAGAQPTRPYTFSRKIFAEGMRDGVPIALGYFAVSFSLGIAARTAGLTPLSSMISRATRRHAFRQMRTTATVWPSAESA